MITRERLRALFEAGQIRAIDYHLGITLARRAQSEPDAIALAGALGSIALGQGDVCVELGAIEGQLFGGREPLDLDWLRGALAREPDLCALGDSAPGRPLVLDGERLYLQRYWQSECRVAQRLLARAAQRFAADGAQTMLAQLFAQPSPGAAGQKLACAVALSRGFAVITGGPGTGKTTTVARLLVLLLAAARAEGKALAIRLAAPTGKAAARVAESLARETAALRAASAVDAALLDALPRGAQTLHRLLGAGANGFRHDRSNPLPVDLVVLDECSMIDLRLLDALLAALPERARLVMIGDSEQLAAVEAGSVFGALCAGAGRYSVARAAELQALCGVEVRINVTEEATPLRDTLARLEHSYRFDAAGGIGKLAAAVNAGDAAGANAVLDDGDEAITRRVYTEHLEEAHIVELADGYAPLCAALSTGAEPAQLLALQENFRVLCALREGEFGVAGLNRAIERALHAARAIDASEIFYPGRPLLVSRNDHGLQLYNGDLGLVVRAEDGQREVLFRSPDGTVRRIPPGRLPEHETAFAMTVHKSQGSEFDQVCLVLPPESSAAALAGREMLYTAITRARQRVVLMMPQQTLGARWFERARRVSGLAQRLHKLPG